MVIKHKSFFLIVSIVMVFLISACSIKVTGGSGSNSDSANEWSEPYRLALDDIMSVDTALNEKMEYISLDYNKELPLSDSDKKNIEEYLQNKYNVKIYTLTYEQLVEKGLHDQSETKLKGVLLKVEKHLQSDSKDNITIEVSKYRANEGAISAEIVLAYGNGQWKVSTYNSIRES